MPRIQRLRHLRDFNEAADWASGKHCLTNVSFNGDAPEAIRLNLRSPNSSFRRPAHPGPILFPRNNPSFEIHNPALLISSSQLNDLQKNFAVVNEALGGHPLPSIPFADPTNEVILTEIQEKSYEIAWIDSVLDSLSLDTALYRSYLRKSRTVNLFDHQVATEQAVVLLDEFQLASELYSQLPELRDYHVQNEVQVDDIGPRGQQFREWLQGHAINDGANITLEFVAYELRPLRIFGRNFQWQMGPLPEGAVPQRATGDLRRVAVDLLLRYDGHPVWCEVKAKGDTWTSSAMQQILFYGSMLSSGNQKRRCGRCYPDEFQCFQPWLGILVEQRNDDQDFIADYEQTLNFANSQSVKKSLRDLFGGLFIGMFQQTGTDWTLCKPHIIRWN
jgi:hypothetical protein